MQKVIGASRSPTPYKIRSPNDQYVRCGADILLNGANHDLEGESICIACGRTTRVAIIRRGVVEVEPPEAVLHVGEFRAEDGSVQILCEDSPIFDRRECLETWLKGYRALPGKVFKLQECMPRALQLVSERVRPARREGSLKKRDQTTRVMRCADCDCSPAECALSSSLNCPNCRLEFCCCWTAIN